MSAWQSKILYPHNNNKKNLCSILRNWGKSELLCAMFKSFNLVDEGGKQDNM